MTTHTARVALWTRIQRLMDDRWGAENLSRLAREAHVGVATIARIKQADTSVGLDVLEKVAAALGVEAWQLIAPDEPERHANAVGLSPLGLDLARTLDLITDPTQHRRAYAVASQVLSFGVAPVATPAPATRARDEEPAGEPRPNS